MSEGIVPVVLERFDKAACRLQAIQLLADAGRQPVYPVEFRSQFGEDALIWTLCAGQLDGFFVEAGAFDGYTYAATYALECVGWTGLLVEAIPERAAQCGARRRNSRVVQAALGATHGGDTTFMVTDDAHGGMYSHVDTSRVAKKSVVSLKSRAVAVPLTTLNELLQDHRGEVDVVVIDVEGSEIPALAGLDLKRHQPKVLLIEDNVRGGDPALASHMAGMPYTQVAWLKVNRAYVREDLAADWVQRLRP
jgi:FkbM family methyltransferase